MSKLQIYSKESEAFTQVLAQLSNIDSFMAAEAEAKSQNHSPNWDCITGINHLVGFVGAHRSIVMRLLKTGVIPGYKVNGTYYFLVFEILRAINTNEELFLINWESYEDTESSPDEMKIHWKKFLFPDRVLVKFTYLRWTSTLSLPVTIWGKNSKIIKRMISGINKRGAIVPFNTSAR